jgi:Asp-tRNA(Asn)/Glu-tRNA(Gln) amidotransferase A subunit family amidase
MTQMQTDLCYLTIRDAGRLLQSRQLSPVELTRAFLNRIEQLDATLQSYITVLSDRALS